MTKEEREEAAKILKLEQSSWRKNPNLKVDQRLYDAYNVAIEVLQEESVLDKIKAEIEEPLKINESLHTESAKAQAISLSWCIDIIDKYRELQAESKVK